MADDTQPSRHERVVQILDDAQGKQIPDYQGYGAFWRLPIAELEQVEIYGQRMIAAPESGDAPDPHDRKAGGGGCCGSGKTDESQRSEGPPSPALNAVQMQPSWTPDTSCWPSGGSGGGTASKSNDPHARGAGLNSASSSTAQRRSDRSGLIRGLRGQAPFDGGEFPPLLWNAARPLSSSEIQFIADWIDAGCPDAERDRSKLEATRVHSLRALARGEQAHRVSTSPVNLRQGRDDIYTGGGLAIRKEISSMDATELDTLRRGLDCMYQYNGHVLDERSFDYWARIHTNSCEHGWEQFLPWHRLYLYFFEQQLRDFDASITLPYWSWTDYTDVNKGTYQTKQLDIGIIPEAYRCVLTRAGYGRLAASRLFTEAQLAGLEATIGTSYNSGLRFLRAAGLDYQTVTVNGQVAWSDQTRVVYDELRRSNALWFPNRWPGSAGSAAHYPTKADVDAILAIPDWPSFGGGPPYDHHFGALEEVHNGMHNFAGGKNPAFGSTGDPQNEQNPQYGYMTNNRTTAFDPIFWAHHCNVDRVWAVWQGLHPGQLPEETDGAMPPWSLTVRDSLSIRQLGYEYMRDAYHYPTDNDTPMLRFMGERVGVRAQVLDTYRKAEVRLHGVRRGNLFNAIIRVFLNAPDAGHETKLEHNPNYVGQVTTFHGSCVGGPGHCDLPLPRTRKTDLRHLHHHQPRNFRIDATAAVQRLVSAGADDLSVHLVVCDLDGTPREDALFLDGVSLCFLD